MIGICGLWKNKGKDGDVYLSGSIGVGAKLFVFPNKNKTKQNQPDYTLVIGEKKQDNSKSGSYAKKPRSFDDDDGGYDEEPF